MASQLTTFLKGISGYTKAKDDIKKHWTNDLGAEEADFNAGGKLLKANKWVAIAKAVFDGIAGVINKYSEFQKALFEKDFKNASAKATAEVNKLSAAVDAWANSMNGASQSLKTYTQNITSQAKARRDSELEWEKFKSKQTSEAIGMVPLVGDIFKGVTDSINNYRDQLLEQENQEIDKRIELAGQYIDKANTMTETVKKYLDALDKEVVTYARRNAMSVQQTQLIRKAELDHSKYYATLNATVEDALKILNNYRSSTGRAVNMSLDATMSSIAAGKVIGEEVVASTQSQLYLFNKSAGDVANMMVKTQNSVGRMGLSTQKVMKSISENLKLAQDFQFKNGTAGLREMTIMAENLRFNMSSLSSMLNKIQDNGLAGIVEQSAKLQVLGGNIGIGADPFALAYNAFQDPKQMMENVSKMLKGFGTFDRTTGETKFAINEQIRLKAFADAMGMNKTDVMNMVREANKKEVVKGLINDGRFSDEQMSAISNLATRRENGEWEVETLDGRSMNVKDVRPEDLDRLLSNNQEDRATQYAKAQLNTTERIEVTTKSINAAIGGTLWEPYNTMVNKVNEQTLNAYTANQKGIQDSVQGTFKEQINQQGQMLTTLNDFYNEYLKSQTEFKLAEILTKDKDDITNNDRDVAAKLVANQLKTFMREYGVSADKMFNDDGTIKKEVYTSDYIRKITGGRSNLTPINESQMQKLGLESKYWSTAGTTLFNYTLGKPFHDFPQGVDNWVNGRSWGSGATLPDTGVDYQSQNIRDIQVNDMVYNPSGGFHPIVTAGDVRAHLSPEDTIVAMKKNGPIASATGGNGKVDVNINGSIRLDADGASVDLSELSKNPIFIRQITQMIAESKYSRVNGTHDYN